MTTSCRGQKEREAYSLSFSRGGPVLGPADSDDMYGFSAVTPNPARPDLGRFLLEQNRQTRRGNTIAGEAWQELVDGKKSRHWMHVIFPNPPFGRTRRSRWFALASRQEAELFASHPVLGSRLITLSEVVARWGGRRSLRDIFGRVDAMKFRSSMTVFSEVNECDVFAAALTAHGVSSDPAALEWLDR